MLSCYLCHDFELREYSIKNSFVIYQCQNCDHLFVAKPPVQLAPYYVEGYFTGDVSLDAYMDYEADKEASRATFIKYLELLNKHLVGQKRLLEVGCATGFFLDLAKKAGWEVAGLDISEYAVAQAQAKNIQAWAGTLSQLPEQLKNKQYEAVAMFDVLEHLTDPLADLRQVAALLADAGLLILSTPKADSWWAKLMGKHWHAFVPPQHLHFFSEKNLRRVLTEAGLEIVWAGDLGKKFTTPYIFRALYSWQKLAIWKWLAGLTNRGLLKNLSFSINLHDNMVILARKNTYVAK